MVVQKHSFLDLLQDKTNYLKNRPVNRGIFGRDFDTDLSGLIGGSASRGSAVIKRAYAERLSAYPHSLNLTPSQVASCRLSAVISAFFVH